MATKKAVTTPAKKTAAKTADTPKPAAKKAAAKKTPAAESEATKLPGKKKPPTQSEIAALAHQYWQERGGHHGSHNDDWLRAEKELMS